jgi:transitional endoplasmic reticulum ATPase
MAENNRGNGGKEPDKEESLEKKYSDLVKCVTVQGEYISRLEAHNRKLKEYIDYQKKKLEEYASPAEHLENEFSVLSEDVHFSDVGGLECVVSQIRNFEYGMQYPKLYEAYGIKTPRGLLLHGPPGCGKTMIAKAISNELGAYFLEIPVTRFISKWVGEAEKTLDAILRKCNDIYEKQGVKVVACLDEAEQVFGKRGHDSSGVMDRCLSVWLRYMDGMAKGDGIIYVALTNRVDMIDDAIKRAGRFDYIVEIPYPDRKGVEEILRKQVTYKERIAQRKIYDISESGYSTIAGMLHGMGASGADVELVLRNAAVRQIRSLVEIDEDSISSEVTPESAVITESLLEDEVRAYTIANRRQEHKKIGFGL